MLTLIQRPRITLQTRQGLVFGALCRSLLQTGKNYISFCVVIYYIMITLITPVASLNIIYFLCPMCNLGSIIISSHFHNKTKLKVHTQCASAVQLLLCQQMSPTCSMNEGLSSEAIFNTMVQNGLKLPKASFGHH